jgi:cytochrome bd-type quinol oxidase subunit 2
MNEYLHWWYTLVNLFLLTPLLIAASFVVSWFTKDSKTTRTMLFTSQILALISIILLALWNIIYFIAIYKKDLYYSGMGDIEKNVYSTQSKKVFLFIMLAESVVMVIFFCYGIWVASTYRELMHGNGAFNTEEDEDDEKAKK